MVLQPEISSREIWREMQEKHLVALLGVYIYLSNKRFIVGFTCIVDLALIFFFIIIQSVSVAQSF